MKLYLNYNRVEMKREKKKMKENLYKRLKCLHMMMISERRCDATHATEVNDQKVCVNTINKEFYKLKKY
jgi:hypothetical protein